MVADVWRCDKQYLIAFLALVCENSQVNKMTPSNLAIVFGPTLMRPKTETIESTLNSPLVNHVFQRFIEVCLPLLISPLFASLSDGFRRDRTIFRPSTCETLSHRPLLLSLRLSALDSCILPSFPLLLPLLLPSPLLCVLWFDDKQTKTTTATR